MEFRLFYRGGLRANAPADEKQRLRLLFHKQLQKLWRQPPLDRQNLRFVGQEASDAYARAQRTVGPFRCMPLVSSQANLVAEVEILFLRPERPGAILGSGGDIDNRLKTLLDGLRMPKDGEIGLSVAPLAEGGPLYCLLEDDVLITRLAVTTDQLFDVDANRSGDVVLVIHVFVKEAGSVADHWSILPLLDSSGEPR